MGGMPLPVAISTHSPRVGRTSRRLSCQNIFCHFNSLAPCGANRNKRSTCERNHQISTHSPRVGRTLASIPAIVATEISTHSPRVGRTGSDFANSMRLKISTHSPRVGRTLRRCNMCIIAIYISTHSPRVGRTPFYEWWRSPEYRFQLTRPVWGEPDNTMAIFNDKANFNSLAPCGANLDTRRAASQERRISTHSPRVGRTKRVLQSTVRRIYFNSLAPCGANQNYLNDDNSISEFQLTRPVWGEPIVYPNRQANTQISTHSPRVGRTHSSSCFVVPCSSFQLTRPVWGEPLVASPRR